MYAIGIAVGTLNSTCKLQTKQQLEGHVCRIFSDYAYQGSLSGLEQLHIRLIVLLILQSTAILPTSFVAVTKKEISSFTIKSQSLVVINAVIMLIVNVENS